MKDIRLSVLAGKIHTGLVNFALTLVLLTSKKFLNPKMYFNRNNKFARETIENFNQLVGIFIGGFAYYDNGSITCDIKFNMCGN